MSDLHALAERLEKATDDDWELNRDLGLALGGWSYLPPTHEVAERFPEYQWLDNGDGEIFADSSGAIQEPDYTSSLDAAVALCERVLPGHSLSVGQNVHHKYWHALVQRLSEHDAAPYIEGEAEAPTPALALCLAVVRAKIAELGGKP